MRVRNNQYWWHIIGWLAYLCTVIIGTEQADRSFWIYLTSVKIPVILLFYTCLGYIFPRYLFTHQYISLFLVTLSAILLSVALRFLILALVAGVDFLKEASYEDWQFEFWRHFRLSLGFIGIALALWYYTKNSEMEKVLLESELRALKQQINPHFLYNTLNYFYSKSLSLSPDLARGIGILSELMRYSIGSTQGNGYASLQDEITQINHYIELQQLRFSNILQIEFKQSISNPEQKIVSMIIMNFVENAFKHGDLHDSSFPLKIYLQSNAQGLSFQIENKISEKSNNTTSGIGIENTKKRLAIAYPGRHALHISKTESTYIVQLSIVW